VYGVPAEDRLDAFHNFGTGFEIDAAHEPDGDPGQNRWYPMLADKLGLDEDNFTPVCDFHRQPVGPSAGYDA